MTDKDKYKFQQKVRKVLQSVALHGYDLICAEHDTIKVMEEYAEQRIREELPEYGIWYLNALHNGWITGSDDEIIDKYLKQKK